MDDDFSANQHEADAKSDLSEQTAAEEIMKLRTDFQARLVAANLRTEAIRAGMIDLDGLKLIDVSAVHLDDNDTIADGGKIMSDLRRSKPWLFGAAASSSSTIVPPASQTVRQKTAMAMTDEEYVVARSAITKYQF